MTTLEARLAVATPIRLDVMTEWSSTTRHLEVKLKIDSLVATTGEIRAGCLVLEDRVTGTGSGYDQSNNFDDDIDHPYFGAGNPIVGYEHRYVVRDAFGGTFGATGIVPSTTNAGEGHQAIFAGTVPAEWNENEGLVACYVSRYSVEPGEKEVLNAAQATFSGTSNNELLWFDYFESGSADEWDVVVGEVEVQDS